MRRLHVEGGGRIAVILAFVFPAIISAALALAYYGYLYAEYASERIQAEFQDNARLDAERLFATIEARIDDEARALFARVDMARADPAVDHCLVELPPTVLSYVLFDENRQLKCQSGRRTEWLEFQESLDRESLKPGNFRHLHRPFRNKSELIAFYRAADEWLVAARFKTDTIRAEWLPELLGTLAKTRRVAIVNEQGTALFGDPGRTGHDRFFFEAPFGKTLYSWRIRIAPQDVEALQVQAERQRVLGPLLIILSTVIIAVGLGIVWLAVLAERRASRLKSDFIANVSHELKTPLSLIRMFGELVATGKHKGEIAAREYGAIITRESERLSHLIDNVLDFARIERGKASYTFSEGDIGDVLERALDVCRYRLEKEKLKLRTQIDPGLPPVRMDENALTLVILNLVDNAIKYAAEGGLVDVTLDRTPGGVVLSVRDYGPGIAPEEKTRIFERFYRARSVRDRNVRGSGIGLALVKHIAEAHGGRVTVESPAGSGWGGPGALFRVFLPAPVARGTDPAGRQEVSGLDVVSS